MNLFFIHTPFQLVVAQSVILEEHLSDNIMLYGYVKGNKAFLESYKLIKCEELWYKTIEFDSIGFWAEFHEMKYYIKDLFQNIKNVIKLKRIIKKNNISAVYLSDFNNDSYKLMAFWMQKKRIKINFFEEGSSHYHVLHNPYVRNNVKNKLLATFMDYTFFLPFLKLKWGNYLKCEDFNIKNLHIYYRYSLRPFYHETFDKQLNSHVIFSPQLLQYIEEECACVDLNNAILFMTSPIYEILITDDSEYLEVMKDYFLKLDKGIKLVLKFHPREKQKVKNEILSFLKKYRVEFYLLSSNIPIPVELYLQKYRFKEIVSFYTSTSFYNGYLFPKTKFSYLIDEYCHKCVMNGKTNLTRLSEIIDMVKKIQTD